MSSLDELGIKYGTDKASVYMKDGQEVNGHDYLRRYELFLRELIDEEFTLVELGVDKGASLKMWEEYFPKAFIIGVDLDPDVSRLDTDRIKCITADATSKDLPNTICKMLNGRAKCIIDDCSHAWSSQRMSMENLFPALLDRGGYYIVEDLGCNAMGAYPDQPPKILDSQRFFDYALDRMNILRVSENLDPFRRRPYFLELPESARMIESGLDMAIVIPGAIIFKKK